MAFFSRRKEPEQIGLELSCRFKKVISTIPDELSSIDVDEILFNLEDVDKTQIIRELSILTFISQRLAIQHCQKKKGGKRSEDERKAICSAFDSHAIEYLDKSSEFYNLLDQRGEQYFKLLQSHLDEIQRGEWKKFFERLRFEFEQYCRGGGNEDDPVIVGSFFSQVPLWLLSSHYWSEGFTWTFKYLVENE